MNSVIKMGAVAALLTTSACATMTRGTSEVFIVESTPASAQVSIDNGMTCDATPCSFKVKRKGVLVVTVSKDGYEASTHTINTQVSRGGGTAMAGNVLLGGLIGAGVDASNGSMLDHKPNPLIVTLVQIIEAAKTVEAVVEDAVDAVSDAVDEAVAVEAEASEAVEATEVAVESADEAVAEVAEDAADAAIEDAVEAVEDAADDAAEEVAEEVVEAATE